MPKKSHHISNVINIKIDTTKKTKKRKSKRKKHINAIVPQSNAGYSSLTPYLPLTNKPYYMETSSLLLNPQLQIQDVPKPTSHAAFQPPLPPPALTDHSDNDDNNSQISPISPRLSYSKMYPHPPDQFYDQIPLPTPHIHEFEDQSVSAGTSALMKTANEHVNGKKLRAFANKVNVYHSSSIKNRSDYEHEIELINRRAKTREKAEAAGTAREHYFSAKDIQAQKDNRAQKKG